MSAIPRAELERRLEEIIESDAKDDVRVRAIELYAKLEGYLAPGGVRREEALKSVVRISHEAKEGSRAAKLARAESEGGVR